MDARMLARFRIQATGGITRRHAIPSLGVAIAAVWSSDNGSAAAGNETKKVKRVKRAFAQRCSRQRAQCRAWFASEPNFPCCDSCFSDDFVTCFFSSIAE
jgi:hypothetical protein